MIEQIRAKYTANKINKLSPKLFLDIGCNNRTLEKYLHPNITYIGIDISSSPTIRADVLHLPFKNNIFPLVNISEVLEHLDNPVSAIKEIKRVLKNNGSLFIDIPNPLRLDTLLEWIFRKKSLSSSEHITSFEIKQIYNIAKKCGLFCEYLETRFILFPTFSHFNSILISIKSRIGGYNYFKLSKP